MPDNEVRYMIVFSAEIEVTSGDFIHTVAGAVAERAIAAFDERSIASDSSIRSFDITEMYAVLIRKNPGQT